MTKGAFERHRAVDMRMQKESARTVASSKVFDDCTHSTGGGTEERRVADGQRRR